MDDFYDTPEERLGEAGVQEALGNSEPFLAFQEQLSRVARVDRPVLIIGERGTGKELAAARIHYLSQRWQEPFIALNCAALASTLIESELFGHEAGSFTGAARKRHGRFENASGGTLFLDEIANIPLETQEKILRVVEYGSFERVGGSDPIQVDARIVGATNRNLGQMAEEGEFMRDLLDRLSFEVLFVPALRDRIDDIMYLANHFAARMAVDLGWPQVPEFTDDAIEKLETYHWPGNVRELKNVVERAVYRSDDAIISDDEVVFDPFESPYEFGERPRKRKVEQSTANEALASAQETETPPAGTNLNDAVRELELRMLTEALDQSKYNQKKAAEILGLTYHQFRGLYRKYGDALKD
jgi:psp operon transcriptional activator